MSLWRREDFQQAAGATLRPGGLEPTRRGLVLCRRHCGLEPGASVLDLGCGTGATLNLLDEEGYRAFGVDRDAPRAPTPGTAEVLGADVMRLPFADAVMDAVVCECVLSLLPSPQAALEEWNRVLRPGGALLLTDFYLRRAPVGTGCANAPAIPHAGACLDGARPAATWNALLARAGFFLHAFEDHSAGLAELAARIVWHGRPDLPRAFPLLSSCGCRAHYGYGLWTAQRTDQP